MKKKGNPKEIEDRLVLQLYVSGMSARSMQAIENITSLCEEYFKDAYDLEIIDLYKNPELAAAQQIVFSPSLIKLNPQPRKVLIGNFFDRQKVLRNLGIAVD